MHNLDNNFFSRCGYHDTIKSLSFIFSQCSIGRADIYSALKSVSSVLTFYCIVDLLSLSQSIGISIGQGCITV